MSDPTRSDRPLPLSVRLMEANLPSGGFVTENGVERYETPIKLIDGIPHVHSVSMMGYAQCASRIWWQPIPLREAADVLRARHPEMAERLERLEMALTAGPSREIDGETLWFPRMTRKRGENGRIEIDGVWVDIPIMEAYGLLIVIEDENRPPRPPLTLKQQAKRQKEREELDRTMAALRAKGLIPPR